MITSRKRLLNTLAGDTCDRVPISTYELVGFNSKSFENQEPSYSRLMSTIREQTDCICMWDPVPNTVFLESAHPVPVEQTVFKEVDSVITRKKVHTPKGELTSVSKVITGINTTWQVEHWCKDLDDIEKAISVPYEPLHYDISDFERIKKEVGENGIIMTSLADPLWLTADLISFSDYTVWATSQTEHFETIFQQLHQRCIQNLKNLLDINIVDLYRICGPEYATPPYLPPQFFERFVVPSVKEMCELIHQKGAKVRLHCHGKISQVLHMIEQTGATGLDPCEAPPDGDISLEEVKARIGDKICLFGNIQLKLLENGTPDEVRQAVKECMNAAKKGGKYIIMPTAAPINIPLSKQTEENYLHFIDTAITFGKY